MNVLPLILLLSQLAVATVLAVDVPTANVSGTKNASLSSAANGTVGSTAAPATIAGASTVLKPVNSSDKITKLTEVAKDKDKDTVKSDLPEKPNNNNNNTGDNGTAAAAHRSRNVKKTETPTVQSATAAPGTTATAAPATVVAQAPVPPKVDKKLAEGGTESDVIGINSVGAKDASNATVPKAAPDAASNNSSATVPAAASPAGANNGSSSSSSTSTTTTTAAAAATSSSSSTSTTTTTTTTTTTSTTTTSTTTTPKPLPAKPTITKSMSVPIDGEQEPSVKATGTAGTSAIPGSIDASSKPDPLAQPVQDMSLANRTGENEYIVPLVTVMLTVPLAIAVFIIVYRRFRDLWSTRHYRRMDFLVDGMYND